MDGNPLLFLEKGRKTFIYFLLFIGKNLVFTSVAV